MAVEVLQMSDDLSFQKTLPKLMQVEQRILVQPSAHYKEAMVQAFGANVKRCFYCNQPGHIKAMCHRRKADMQRKAEDAPRRVVAFWCLQLMNKCSCKVFWLGRCTLLRNYWNQGSLCQSFTLCTCTRKSFPRVGGLPRFMLWQFEHCAHPLGIVEAGCAFAHQLGMDLS